MTTIRGIILSKVVFESLKPLSRMAFFMIIIMYIKAISKKIINCGLFEKILKLLSMADNLP